jgi:hypothetical protein
MKRASVVTTIALGLSALITVSQARAQGATVPVAAADGVALAAPAPWLQTKDYGTGALLAIGGLVGALITTFFLVGGPVPGIAGRARIDAQSTQLDELSKRLGGLVRAAAIDAAAIAAVEKTVNNLRDDLRAEIRWQYAVASLLYAVLGAAIAALLARDLLQAVLIGAGWTGLLGSIGLKKDYETRKEMKDATLGEAASLISQANPPDAARDQVVQKIKVALAL